MFNTAYPNNWDDYDDEAKAKWTQMRDEFRETEHRVQSSKFSLQRFEDEQKMEIKGKALGVLADAYADTRTRANSLKADMIKVFDNTYEAHMLDGDGHGIYPLEMFEKNTPPAWHAALKPLVGVFNVGTGHNSQQRNCPIVVGISSLEFHGWAKSLVNAVDPTAGLKEPGGSGRGSCAQRIAYDIRAWCGPFVVKKKKLALKKRSKKAAPKKGVSKKAIKQPKAQPAKAKKAAHK